MKRNNKIDESLLRDRTKKQLQNLKRTIDSEGGDIEHKVRTTSKYKENKMPNAYYMDNPFSSKREIDTWEHFSKNDANNKSIAAASTQPSNIKKLSRFTDFKKRSNLKESINESKKPEFEIDKPIGEMEELFIDLHESPENYDINKDGFDKLYKLMSKYDLEETNDVLVTFRKMSDSDKKEALSFIGATEDMIENAFNETVYESKDKKLFESNKKLKKWQINEITEILDDMDIYGYTNDIISIIEGEESESVKSDIKSFAEDNNLLEATTWEQKLIYFVERNGLASVYEDIFNILGIDYDDSFLYESKNDEELYLTPKQRKLPEGLKKGIIKKMKKSGKKLNDKKDKEECNDCDDDKKDDKKDKKNDINKSDEEKYLTPKQRKLPEGLKKGIIKKAKKSSKINESVDISDQLTEEEVEGAKQIESPNDFFNRYELKDGRIIDVAPSGKMTLVSDDDNNTED